MSATILDALQNAEYNLITNKDVPVAFLIGKDQLHNAIELLDKGYSIHEEIEPLLELYGDVENVPEAEKEQYP